MNKPRLALKLKVDRFYLIIFLINHFVLVLLEVFKLRYYPSQEIFRLSFEVWDIVVILFINQIGYLWFKLIRNVLDEQIQVIVFLSFVLEFNFLKQLKVQIIGHIILFFNVVKYCGLLLNGRGNIIVAFDDPSQLATNQREENNPHNLHYKCEIPLNCVSTTNIAVSNCGDCCYCKVIGNWVNLKICVVLIPVFNNPVSVYYRPIRLHQIFSVWHTGNKYPKAGHNVA